MCSGGLPARCVYVQRGAALRAMAALSPMALESVRKLAVSVVIFFAAASFAGMPLASRRSCSRLAHLRRPMTQTVEQWMVYLISAI